MSPLALFGRPEALPLLAAAPLAWIALRALDRARARRTTALAGPREAVLASAPTRRPRRFRRAAFATGLLLVAAAFARPTFGAGTALAPRGAAVVVCLDVSRSMLARDLAPSRLERARGEVRALCETVRGDRVALVLFAGEARLAVPLTRDARAVADVADLATPASVEKGGTDLGAALATALRALDGAEGDASAIFLLTDGEDHEGRGLAAARACADRGVLVGAVGMGSARGGKIAVGAVGAERFLADATGADVVTRLDEDGLARLADAAGGAYVTAGDGPTALPGLFSTRVVARAARAHVEAVRRTREDRYQWPLALGLLVLLVEFAVASRSRA